jgi:1-aminocyclopropane-1-carboxylate deaminase/D-cysteine desulfhydrase-like pyridoxal-dependent ACC family enzyme
LNDSAANGYKVMVAPSFLRNQFSDDSRCGLQTLVLLGGIDKNHIRVSENVMKLLGVQASDIAINNEVWFSFKEHGGVIQ